MPAGLDGNPEPIRSARRDAVLAAVARLIAERRVEGRPLLVAVDGIDGAGKTTFADELAAHLARDPAVVATDDLIRATIDAFHQPRTRRWARGRTSPVGFYLRADLVIDNNDLATPVIVEPSAVERHHPA